MEIIYTAHAAAMLNERKIPREWIERAILDPDSNYKADDGNNHYIKSIPEFGNRFLRVVVHPNEKPFRVITFFFDRRIINYENTSR